MLTIIFHLVLAVYFFISPVSPCGPGTILISFFSLIRPNYSNMKRPFNSLLEKIVIGQIDSGIWDSF